MIREIFADEFHLVWPIFKEVVTRGDSYSYSPSITEAEACGLWTTAPSRVFIMEHDSEVVGGYMLRPNQQGLGDHVANAGYLVASKWRGQGFAGELCEHSLDTARQAGFKAMQFNFVVSTNEPAVHLWQKHGFEIVGRVPKAFRHSTLGPTDVLIMHRFLD
jgi:GNAT superfamily N-acetyltransferase